jgi:acyl-CoA reductase-like NAD-dependent aldehyde dehydrogenase
MIVMDTLLAHQDELFIAGRWEKPLGDARADVINPFDESVVASLPLPSVADAAIAVEAARKAFPPWNALGLQARREIVGRWCDALTERKDDIVKMWALEAGVPVTDGAALTDAMTAMFADTMAISETMELSEIRETSFGRVEVRHDGVGPTVAILTYNGPHDEFAESVVPAMLAGNTFILKLPPENRLLGYVFAAAAEAAEFPAGVVSILAGEADVSEYLVGHPDVSAVHFTGGTEIATRVLKSTADRIARVALELGGKSAAIVAKDADLDATIPHIVGSWGMYSGQICIAMTRVLVDREIYDDVCARLVAGMAVLRMGDPLDPDTQWGPLAASRVRDRAEGYIARAQSEGATLAYGGGRPEGFEKGWFLEPTVFTDVSNKMEVAQSEIFGPVYVVIPFDDIDEAVEIANDSPYGLAGCVFSEDMDLATDVSHRVDVGVFAINGTFPNLGGPFGGVKQSGFGRACGPEGILELTNIKAIALPPLQ